MRRRADQWHGAVALEADRRPARRRAGKDDVIGRLLENGAGIARGQLDSLRSSLDLSAESLRLTLLRYQAGEATALEVVDAQSTLAQARNAYDDGLGRYRVAVAALQTISGRL